MREGGCLWSFCSILQSKTEQRRFQLHYLETLQMEKHMNYDLYF